MDFSPMLQALLEGGFAARPLGPVRRTPTRTRPASPDNEAWRCGRNSLIEPSGWRWITYCVVSVFVIVSFILSIAAIAI
jgi:hypothetical protein